MSLGILTIKVIDDSANELLAGYRENKITFEEIEDLLLEATNDEEYEVAMSVQKVINILKAENNSKG